MSASGVFRQTGALTLLSTCRQTRRNDCDGLLSVKVGAAHIGEQRLFKKKKQHDGDLVDSVVQQKHKKKKEKKISLSW